jgi:hypothetical protein
VAGALYLLPMAIVRYAPRLKVAGALYLLPMAIVRYVPSLEAAGTILEPTQPPAHGYR